MVGAVATGLIVGTAAVIGWAIGGAALDGKWSETFGPVGAGIVAMSLYLLMAIWLAAIWVLVEAVC